MVDAITENMRWADEIRLRTQPQREQEVMELLLETAALASRNEQPQSSLVYSHYSAPGGFSLILVWDTADVPILGSDTALLILEGLKPLGLTDHTVMIEKMEKRKVGT
jgi:hypothetical protein